MKPERLEILIAIGHVLAAACAVAVIVAIVYAAWTGWMGANG